MASERFIDLQIIKPLTKSSAIKGKISLTNLFKEYFDKLNVGYLDPCCPPNSPGAFGCPAISAEPGNSIVCNPDGIFSTGGGGSSTASNGLSVDTTDIVFGQDLSDPNNPAALGSNREIPMNGFNINWIGTGNNTFGYSAAPVLPFATLDISGTVGITSGSNNYSRNGYQGNLPAMLNVVHGSANWGFAITRPGANVGGTNFVFYRTYGTDANTKAAVSAGGSIGRMIYQAVAADNTTIGNAAAIQCNVASSTGSVTRGWLGFVTSDASGFISTERMAISADGNITIGNNATSLGESDLSKFRVAQPIIGGTDAFTGIHLTSSWATAGSPTAFKIDVTETASAASSLLMDIAIGPVTPTSVFKVSKSGQVGIKLGATAPSALLHLAAGTATAGTAPIKLTSGTNLTTPENGTFEYDGTNLYFTTGGTRKTVTLV